MGRSIYCSTCKKEKEPGRDNESRCKACKSEANKQRRALKRQEMGLRPFGSGRDPNCYRCKAVKENPKAGYCNACSRQHDNEWRLSTGRTKKHQDGLCPCGNEKIKPSHSGCKKCMNAYSAKWKREHPISEGQIEKIRVRQLTRYAIRSGYIIEKPCEICGEIKVDAHHDDYSKPLEVRFLCEKHHVEHHINEGFYIKRIKK